MIVELSDAEQHVNARFVTVYPSVTKIFTGKVKVIGKTKIFHHDGMSAPTGSLVKSVSTRERRERGRVAKVGVQQLALG